MRFGECVKNLRLARGLTLRVFTQAVGVRSAEWSRIERGRIAPPAGDWLRMDRIRQALALSPDSEEWKEAWFLAAVEQEMTPLPLSGSEVVGKLPLFIRSLDAPMDNESLDRLVETIRRA